MSSKNMNNYYDSNYNNNTNLNYDYNYSNNNNNYYNNNNYNNQYNNNQNNYSQPYGNVLHYYNNYPVYSSIPPQGPYTNNQEQNNNNNENDYSKKSSNDFTDQKPKTILRGKKGTKGAIILTPNKQNMCFMREPQYYPNFAGIQKGRPAYTYKHPK